MFKCNRCGQVFHIDDAATEDFLHTEVQPRYVERFLICPYCGSADYDDYYEDDEDDESTV